MNAVVIWIIVAIAVIGIDIATSSFIFMWFSIGAFISAVLAVFNVAVPIQICTFLAIGIITVAVGYPWAKKNFRADVNKTLTMEQTYIGKEMIATEDMKETSKIKVSGIYWTAYNKGKEIKKGEKFIITGIEGNKLVVNLKED